MAQTETPARLKSRYFEEIRPALIQRFGYSSVMQAPRIDKITLNMGVGDAKQDSKALEVAQGQLATIAGQRPNVRRARKSIAAFKLREGMAVGVAVTLRSERAYEFLDRLMSVAIPRIRDFRGLSPARSTGAATTRSACASRSSSPRSTTTRSNMVRGLDVTITTTARSDAEAFALLEALGMPFSREGRPADFQSIREAPVEADGAVVTETPAEPEAAADEPEAVEVVEEPEAVEAVEEPEGCRGA